MQIGFIGLGQMGAAIARNLVKAGHRVRVFNRTREKAQQLAGDGAEVARSPREAAETADAVFTMVADDAALEAVSFGEDGFLAGLTPQGLHVSLSTISVRLSERLLAEHQDRRQQYVAAPVLGRPDAAAAAKLFIIAAGDHAAIARCEPLLSAIGQRTYVLSAHPPAANVLKLSANFLIASVVESLGEAFALIEKSGIDKQAYLEFLTSSIFAAPVYKTYGGLVANGQFDKVAFPLPLGLKDVRLALAAGEQAGVPMPVASLVRDQMISALARGMGHLDWSALARVAALNAGL